MATLRNRSGKWQVQVRSLGQKTISKTFNSKAEAQIWAWQEEHDLASPKGARVSAAVPTPLLGELVGRYIEEVCPLKRGACEYETILLKAFCKRAPELASKPLGDFKPSDFGAYRNLRLKTVTGETVRRELGVLQHLFNMAATEWELDAPNPLKGLRKPIRNPSRDRRLRPGEHARLVEGLTKCLNPLMPHLVGLALHTGMRRSELLAMQWHQVDLDLGLISIPKTKNGHPRLVPMTAEAKQLLGTLRAGLKNGCGPIFSLSGVAVRQAWDRLMLRTGIHDLNFHDLRHEAISRFFEAGLSLPEVALISGHRDPRMLMRYTHLDALKIARKLQLE